LPTSCFRRKIGVAYKLYPKGTFIQLFIELSNGNLTGIENDNHDGETNSFFAPQPHQSKYLAELFEILLMIVL
jgi:hypothetical protein